MIKSPVIKAITATVSALMIFSAVSVSANAASIDNNSKTLSKFQIKTSDNKIAINFGTELHIINKNGILLRKYISDTEINDIVMTDALVGIVYKDKIQIINF